MRRNRCRCEVSASAGACALARRALARRPARAAPRRGAAPAPGLEQRSGAAEGAAAARGELWATIDVCNPADQPNYVGIRGSMPGDRHAHDKMYMRFRLQYMDATSKQWVDLASARRAGLRVRRAGQLASRQGGRSFQLVPAHGQAAVDAARGGRLPVAPRHDGPRVGEPPDERGPQEPRRRGPAGLQRRDLPDRLNSRGSFVMMPSTPSSRQPLDLARVVDRPHVELAAAFRARRARAPASPPASAP